MTAARIRQLLLVASLVGAAALLASAPRSAGAPGPSGGTGTSVGRFGASIVVAGQPVPVGRPVVLWSDPQGFDAYQTRCIEGSGGCCNVDSKRYGVRSGLQSRSLEDLQRLVSQFVLHFDGCVNSRSCFKSMHNRQRPGGGAGCGLSAHFMIDADGTIYQTMDVVERAFHAEVANSGSVGVEICNRGRVDRSEWPRLPAEYRTRPTRVVTVNGERHEAYDFRPEQYDSLIALSRALLRLFPRIQPAIPEERGVAIMDTLADPLAFAGILGHFHVERKKWDPGALDWSRLMRALGGLALPIQVRSFGELPQTERELLAVRRAVYFNAEERASAQFPVGAGRLWHSGVHLRGALGAPVRALGRGRIVAARSGMVGASSRSFVLTRHEIDDHGEAVTFYSLLAHLDLPQNGTAAIPWLEDLAQMQPSKARELAAGRVVLLDERVEAGDLLGFVGRVSRGPEQGPEVHFEIFTAGRLAGELGRTFRYVNASSDGALVRRADVIGPIDKNADQQLEFAEVQDFFRRGSLEARQAFRRLAVRHRHEWGDRNSEEEFVGLRELAGISEKQRRAWYATAIAPYVFWSDQLSEAEGLPANQVIYSYNPLTFLLELAARRVNVTLPVMRGRPVGEAGIEPRKLSVVPVREWTNPSRWADEPALFGPPIGIRLGPRRKQDIPLIELAPTDGG